MKKAQVNRELLEALADEFVFRDRPLFSRLREKSKPCDSGVFVEEELIYDTRTTGWSKELIYDTPTTGWSKAKGVRNENP